MPGSADFSLAMANLTSDVVAQGSRVQRQLELAFDSLFSRDRTKVAEAAKLDDEIDRIDVEIERSAVALLRVRDALSSVGKKSIGFRTAFGGEWLRYYRAWMPVGRNDTMDKYLEDFVGNTPLVRLKRMNAGAGNIILDEAKWGTPAASQVIEQHWDWDLSDAQWAEAVKQKGEGKREDVKFDLWIPEGVATVRGIVAITGHGSGETLYKHAEMRKIARELHLAIFKFVGNPMQRGFWPRGLLGQRIATFAEKVQHPELNHAPLFLYGHSNDTRP